MHIHRHLLERIGHQPEASPPQARPAPLNVCPNCASPYVQPLAWKEAPEGNLQIELRCPECWAWTSGVFSAARAQTLDHALQAGRADLAMLYERSVRQSLGEEADRLAAAFERDLVGPDDFRPAA